MHDDLHTEIGIDAPPEAVKQQGCVTTNDAIKIRAEAAPPGAS